MNDKQLREAIVKLSQKAKSSATFTLAVDEQGINQLVSLITERERLAVERVANDILPVDSGLVLAYIGENTAKILKANYISRSDIVTESEDLLEFVRDAVDAISQPRSNEG